MLLQNPIIIASDQYMRKLQASQWFVSAQPDSGG